MFLQENNNGIFAKTMPKNDKWLDFQNWISIDPFNRITQFHDNYNVNIIDDVVFFDPLLQIKT